MKFTIDVKDFTEAGAIKRALADPEIRALIVSIGILQPLPQHERQGIIDVLARDFGPSGRFAEA